MKKTSVVGGLIIGLGLLLTGCGNSFDYMPNLTEEESMLIAEYAAGILNTIKTRANWQAMRKLRLPMNGRLPAGPMWKNLRLS